jgi:hypothetical protein
MSRYGPASLFIQEAVAEVDPEDGLAYLVRDYDELFDKCWRRVLTDEEHKELNDMHEALSLIEQGYWIGVDEYYVALLQGRLDTDFPMIRYILGMLLKPEDV